MTEFFNIKSPEYADRIPQTRSELSVAMDRLEDEKKRLELELLAIEKQRQALERDTLLGVKTFLQSTVENLGLDRKANKIKIIKKRLEDIEAMLAQYSIQFQAAEK